MVAMAFWLQTGDVSAGYVMWLTIFVGILAVALLLQAIFVALFLGKLTTLLVDLKKSFDETKGKAMPLIASANEISVSAKAILKDLTPKIKIVSENIVETSHTVRQTVNKVNVTVQETADKAAVTFADVNDRTAKQAARVDGMVASALAATADIGNTVYEGIRVPARKIAEITTQSKHLVDTLIDRAKALGIGIGNVVDAKVHEKSRKNGW